MSTFAAAFHDHRLSRTVDDLSWCAVRTATAHIADKRIPLHVIVQFGKGPQPEHRQPVIFNSLRLEEHLLAPHAAQADLLNGILPVLGTHVGDIRWTSRFPFDQWHNHNAKPGPMYHFSATHAFADNILLSKVQSYLRDEVLHGEHKQSFVLPDDAIDWWMGAPVRKRGHSDGNAEYEVRYPLATGDVKKVITSNQETEIHIEMYADGTDGDFSVTLAHSQGGKHLCDTSPTKAGIAKFRESPSGSYVVKVCKGREMISFLRGDSRWSTPGESAQSITDLLQLIHRGECEHVEFKQIGNPKKGKINIDSLAADAIIETVCAFANCNGGHLLLGVDDRGNPVGINDYIPSLILALKCDEAHFERELAGWIKKIISDRIMSVPETEIFWHSINGRRVLRVYTHPNDGALLSEVDNRKPWIRAGSTTRLPTASDLKEIFARKLIGKRHAPNGPYF